MSPPSEFRTRSVADQRRLERWERSAQIPILAAALLPIVFSLAGTQSILANTVMVLAWIVFIADLIVHIRLVPGFLRTRWGIFDLVVVVLTAPWFLIPGMGNARFLILARLARLVRVAKAGGRKLTELAKQLGRVGVVVVVIVFACAYVAYSVERATNPLFNTFGTSLWWAVVTMTTVGYGDVYPITTAGRITGVILMFAGLGLLGVLAGTLASFFGFNEASAEPAEEIPAAIPADASPAELEARLGQLEEAIAAVRRTLQSS